MDQITTDLAQQKYTAALLASLTLLAALAAQGKIAPFLARFTAWQKTFTLAVLASAGIAAQAVSSGLPLVVGLGRAAPPLVMLLGVHFFGVPADPEKAALDAASVHLAARIAAKGPVSIHAYKRAASLLNCLLFCAACAGLSCTPAQKATAKTAVDTVLSVDQMACVLAKGLEYPTLPPAAVAIACDIVPALAPTIDGLLHAQARGTAQFMAEHAK